MPWYIALSTKGTGHIVLDGPFDTKDIAEKTYQIFRSFYYANAEEYLEPDQVDTEPTIEVVFCEGIFEKGDTIHPRLVRYGRRKRETKYPRVDSLAKYLREISEKGSDEE